MACDGLTDQGIFELLEGHDALGDENRAQAGLLLLETEVLVDLLGCEGALTDQNVREVSVGLATEGLHGAIEVLAGDEAALDQEGSETLFLTLLRQGPRHVVCGTHPEPDERLTQKPRVLRLGFQGFFEVRLGQTPPPHQDLAQPGILELTSQNFAQLRWRDRTLGHEDLPQRAVRLGFLHEQGIREVIRRDQPLKQEHLAQTSFLRQFCGSHDLRIVPHGKMPSPKESRPMPRPARPALVGMTVAVAALSPVPSPSPEWEVLDERPSLYRRFAIEVVIEQGGYQLLRDGRPVPDKVLASQPDEDELAGDLARATALWSAGRLAAGLLLVPAGSVVALDNFFGRRDEQVTRGAVTLPPSLVAPFPAEHPITGLLFGAGLLAAGWGIGLLAEQVGTWAGWRQDRLLDPERAQAAAARQREALLLRLNLPEAPPSPSPTPPPAATASPTPKPGLLDESFPEGVEGSMAWAVRLAVVAQGDSTWEPFLAWTDDLEDLERGTISRGSWQVLLRRRPPRPDPAVPYGLVPEVAAGLEPVGDDDVREVTVPRHGGAVTWRGGALAYRVYRSGTKAFRRVRLDAPDALPRLLAAMRAQGEMTWWRPGTRVVLQPFRGRMQGPMWLVIPPGGEPDVALDAERGSLMPLRSRGGPGTGPTAPGRSPGDPMGPAD